MPDTLPHDEQFMKALEAVLQYVEDVAKGRIEHDRDKFSPLVMALVQISGKAAIGPAGEDGGLGD
jgi:F0F1-type ATP synthase membrane subunit a